MEDIIDIIFSEESISTSNKQKTFIPPQEVRNTAKRALDQREKKPVSQRCCTSVGVSRARDLSNGKPVLFDTIKRMHNYFKRHEVDKKDSTWNNFGKSRQVWDMWGGNAGKKWVNYIIKREKEHSKENILSFESLINSISLESSQEKTEKAYIVFFESTNRPEQRFISFITKSDYSHVGITLDKGLKNFYDVVSEGLRNFDLNKKPINRTLRIFSIPISEFQKKQLIKILDIFKNNNIKYDNKTFITTFFKITLPIKIKINPDKFKNEEIKNNSKFICSAFVTSTLVLISPKIKNYLLNKNIDILSITPAQLSQFPELKYEFSYNPFTKKKFK